MKTEKSVTTTTTIRSQFHSLTLQENGGTVPGTVTSIHRTALRHPYDSMLGRVDAQEKLTFTGRAELEDLRDLLTSFLAPVEEPSP